MIYELITDLWFLWILIIVAFAFYLGQPLLRGAGREKNAAVMLNELNPTKYRVMHNIYLGVDGNTRQIDHVVVSDFGIFVIATIKSKGRVSGDEKMEYWTQSLYGKKEKLYSPLRQTYSDILALKYHLKDFPRVKYIPVIVFSASAELRVKAEVDVIYLSHLLRTIKKYTEVNLSTSDKTAILAKINSVHSKSKEAYKKQQKSKV